MEGERTMRLRNLLVAAVRVLLGSAPDPLRYRETVRRLRLRLDYVRVTDVPPTENLGAKFGEDDLMEFVRFVWDAGSRTPSPEGADPDAACASHVLRAWRTRPGAEAVLADLGLSALPESLPPVP